MSIVVDKTRVITVLDPTAPPGIEAMTMAPRVRGLDGKRVGFLWNGKPGGDVLLKRIRERLSERFRLAGTVWQEKTMGGRPIDQAILQELLRNSDLVINAVGD